MKKQWFIIIGLLIFLAGCSNASKIPFSIGPIRIISDDVASMHNQEIDITKSYENRGRIVNVYFPIEREMEIKDMTANMQCSITGYQLFDSLYEAGSRYSFESFKYHKVDLYMEGTADFSGKGTVLNKGSEKGTKIILLKEDGLAHFNLDINFKGEQSAKITCLIDIISEEPPYVASKTVTFNYPGIPGFSVLEDN